MISHLDNSYTHIAPKFSLPHEIIAWRAKKQQDYVVKSYNRAVHDLCLIAHIEQLHTLITDSAAPAETIEELRRRGLKVLLA